MSMINIDHKNPDPFNRYKMPKLVAKVERRRNAFTVLVNLQSVAKSLRRPATYLIKYFGFELSTPIKMDIKNDLYTIRGEHDQNSLQNLLDGFIDKFVLCRYCRNPETKLTFEKENGKKICQQCYACGNITKINMESHRLTTFISRNCFQEDENYINQNLEENIINEQDTTTINDNNDWNDDDDLSLSTNKLDIQSHDFEDTNHSHCQSFIDLFKKNKLDNQLNDPISIQKLLIQAEKFEILEKVPLFIPEYLFTDEILKEIQLYKIFLQKLCEKNSKGQKYLLHGLETIVGTNKQIRTKFFNKKGITEIFLKLYEEDIIIEDVFYEWNEKPLKQFIDQTIEKEIREYAKSFIEWLRTAEESTDEEVN